MRFHTLLVATLALAAPLVPETQAFTYGPYLPSYLCGPTIANATSGTLIGVDGTPKALGGVLNKFAEYIPGGEVYTGAQGDSQVLVASFHNANAAGHDIPYGGTNTITRATGVLDQNILNGAIPVAAQVFILDVGRIPALPAPQAAVVVNGNEVVAALDANMAIPPAPSTHTMTTNELVLLTMQAKNNVPGQLSGNVLTAAQFAASGTQPVLDGATLFVQDAAGNHVGKFVSAGPNAQIWPACGADGQGIVHNQLLSESNSYNGPQYFLPWSFFNPLPANGKAPAPQTVTFMGAAVSDNGFGYHQTKWTVNPTTLALDINALAAQDVISCIKNALPCVASCLDCAQKAGSKKGNPAKNAQLACTPNVAIGNPQKGQQTLFTSTCKINNVATAVATPGTVVIAPAKAAGASSDPVATADALALQDQISQLILTTNNGTTMDMAAMDAMDAAAAPLCPNSTNTGASSNPYNYNGINDATSSSSTSIFTSLAVAALALFARQ